MRKVHVAIEHALEPAAAKTAVEKAFSHYREKYAQYRPTLRWVGDGKAELSFTTKGVTLRGVLGLHPGRIVLDAKVPLVLKPFTKKAVAKIHAELGKWLG